MTKVAATLACVPPADQKPIDPEKVFRDRRDQRNRAVKFLHKNKELASTYKSKTSTESSSPVPFKPPSAGHRSPSPRKERTEPEHSEAELLALCKGVVQEDEIPRLQEWLKSAKVHQRHNYIAVFGALQDTISAGKLLLL